MSVSEFAVCKRATSCNLEMPLRRKEPIPHNLSERTRSQLHYFTLRTRNLAASQLQKRADTSYASSMGKRRSIARHSVEVERELLFAVWSQYMSVCVAVFTVLEYVGGKLLGFLGLALRRLLQARTRH
eukprot:4374129-Amphidinium_carterae.1